MVSRILGYYLSSSSEKNLGFTWKEKKEQSWKHKGLEGEDTRSAQAGTGN